MGIKSKYFPKVATLATMMLLAAAPMNGNVQKICLTGSHGSGKSTLAYKICAELKKRGYNAVVISETARESPFPFGKGQSLETTFFIALRQAVKELEAIAHGYNYLVLDRGVCDSFLYSMAGREGEGSKTENALFKAFVEWMKGYDNVFFIKNDDGHQLAEDGVRDTDEEFAARVQDLFDGFLKRHFPGKYRTFSYTDILTADVHVLPNGEVILSCSPLEEK